jgi:hypothetical protein
MIALPPMMRPERRSATALPGSAQTDARHVRITNSFHHDPEMNLESAAYVALNRHRRTTGQETVMPHATANASTAMSARPRDVRLDLFRGLAMFVIFTAHSPGNPWNDWIPARFGFSSGAELFVFCSGVASAGAFAAVFVRRGWLMGAARILYRCWQVYWAHIGLAVAVIALGALADAAFPGRDFAAAHVGPVMRDAPGALLGLVTLSWLPLFLDILPMYLVILAAIPVLMAARTAHPFMPHAIVAAP